MLSQHTTALTRVLYTDVFPQDLLDDDLLTVEESIDEGEPEEVQELLPQTVEILIGVDGLTDMQREVSRLYLSGSSVEDIAKMVGVRNVGDIDLCLACAFDIMREKEGALVQSVAA